MFKKTIRIKNGIIYTGPKTNKVITGKNIYIENNKIVEISPKIRKVDKVIDAENRVVMPGFINAHMHFYSTLVKGLSKIKPARNFHEVLTNLWWKFDKKLSKDSIYYSSLISSINAIKKGTTTIIDHHSSPSYIENSLLEIEKAVRKVGIRACLCYEVSDRNGKQETERGIEENYNFIKHTQRKNDNFIKAMFGLHASFTLSNRTLEKVASKTQSLDCGFHIHCAEDEIDENNSIKKYGVRVVERLNKFQITGEKSIFAHCVHINEKELEIIKQTQTNIVINPQSNSNNAVGIADIFSFAKKGVIYGLGTDSMTLNMLEEMRAALFLNHLKNKNPSCCFTEVSKLIYNNFIIANKFFDNIGEISPGYFADIIISNYIPYTPINESNFYGHLIFGISQSQIRTTISDGNILMEDFILKINIDENEIAKKAKEISLKIWNNF